jgi:dUTP pyrophosphatase
MKVARIREVKLPTRGTELSAGIDFYVPKFDEKFLIDFKEKNDEIMIATDMIKLFKGERVLIPSGIKAEIPKGYALIGYNKSGVSTRLGLDILASVVDEDYQGEIHISLVNTSKQMIYIEPGQKIIQYILLPVFYDKIEEISFNQIHLGNTQRGVGGFGSTGLL